MEVNQDVISHLLIGNDSIPGVIKSVCAERINDEWLVTVGIDRVTTEAKNAIRSALLSLGVTFRMKVQKAKEVEVHAPTEREPIGEKSAIGLIRKK